ncbi:hypothetical protein AVEN_87278-1 [Araneus ventricosus]|uniref:Uncharacterized protein n=1 Tax=Araneus ventricosus TaxID=182803 RepID=A0A4Y2EE42_ARAVE|nr:hypothetical protein AVEN_87278-1 [Araneus ventricosus]
MTLETYNRVEKAKFHLRFQENSSNFTSAAKWSKLNKLSRSRQNQKGVSKRDTTCTGLGFLELDLFVILYCILSTSSLCSCLIFHSNKNNSSNAEDLKPEPLQNLTPDKDQGQEISRDDHGYFALLRL